MRRRQEVAQPFRAAIAAAGLKSCATICLMTSLLMGAACSATGGFDGPHDGRLTSRPRLSTKSSARGEQPVGLDPRRDGVLFVPSANADHVPLLLMLHGAGGSGEGVLRAVRVGFGADVAFIDRALARAFETLPVDPARVAIGGFSDGATYALSLGLVNGDLFQRVVAFSPGFLVSGLRVGKPLVFISHGTSDQILPIDRTSLLILPGLRQRGYDVTFHEFDGGHEVPPAIAKEGVAWVAHSSSPPR
jgi:phospholipase/carboxylesterase